jgi:hypothetical protein
MLHGGLLRFLVGWQAGVELLVVGVLLLVGLGRSWLLRRGAVVVVARCFRREGA